MDAAASVGISPYHLAARIKQEQGAGNQLSATGRGDNNTYRGYYNFLNIDATGGDVVGNALNTAKREGWDDPEKAIIGGARFIASSYISRGQSTLYLQKFDVDNSDGSLYYHQYMQNVSAAYSEGKTVRSSYANMGLLDSNINFVIPVYYDMPQEPCPSPAEVSVVTQNVKVTGSNVAVRSGKGIGASEIARVGLGDIVLRIEISGNQVDGYNWDKIVLPDGRKGYIARNYISKINDITNANTSAVANTGVNLRNGPGTSDTRVITTLTSGQSVTIIETGKYDGLDGYNWSRVTLSNGTQGYLANIYLTEVAQSNYQIAYVNCNDDGKVYVRGGVGTNNNVVTALGKNTKVTVLQRGAGNANGYTWDKIVTADGLEGFMANCYLRYEENGNNSTNNNSSDGFKLEGTNLITGPDTTVEQLKQQYPNININNVATGVVVNINGEKITIVKLGDVNGDGVVNSGDSLIIKQHVADVKYISNANYLKAADVNKDGKINSGDSLVTKQYVAEIGKITI